MQSLNTIDGVTVTVVQDEAGRAIFRARIQIDSTVTGTTAKEVNDKLRHGDIAIIRVIMEFVKASLILIPVHYKGMTFT